MNVEKIREYMELAVETMYLSVPEKRGDGKATPLVGAVIILSDGKVETACRGELREGDHAEYTLLDRKLRDKDLTDKTMFVTLEPCAPGARKCPKLACAERIVNARIKEVYIGITDPDPKVANKGLNYLRDNGVVVHMFDRDLQEEIFEANKDFLAQAVERANEAKKGNVTKANALDNYRSTADFSALSVNAMQTFCKSAGMKFSAESQEFKNYLINAGLLKKSNDSWQPSQICIALFGENPRLSMPQIGIKAKCTFSDGTESLKEIDGPLVLAMGEFEPWYNTVMRSVTSREHAERKTETVFPFVLIREALVNAIVHRDYAIEGSKIVVSIDDKMIAVQSPGTPFEPITIEDLQNFNAPSLARNPKIAYIFNQMGMMEETGLGLSTFKSAPEKYRLPQPRFSLNNNTLLIQFFRSFNDAANKITVQLNEEERIGYEFIKQVDSVSKKEYAEHFGYDEKKAQRHLKKMLELALLTNKDINPRSKNLRYYIVKD